MRPAPLPVVLPLRGTSAAGRRPLRYSIDGTRGVLCIDLLEADSAPAVIGALRQLHADPEFNPALHLCVDCGYISRVPPPDQIRAILTACLDSARSEFTGRCAIVASHSSVHCAANELATCARMDRVRVFRSYGDALRWLDPNPMRETSSGDRDVKALHEIIRHARLWGV